MDRYQPRMPARQTTRSALVLYRIEPRMDGCDEEGGDLTGELASNRRGVEWERWVSFTLRLECKKEKELARQGLSASASVTSWGLLSAGNPRAIKAEYSERSSSMALSSSVSNAGVASASDRVRSR